MPSPRTRTTAILAALSRSDGSDDAVHRGVLRLFGASSIEECLATYQTVGKAERSGLDEAVERVTASAGPAFLARLEADLARIDDLLPHREPEEPHVLTNEPQPSADDPDASPPEARLPTYQIRRLLLAVGRSYEVEDAAGARVFRIAGKVRFARTFSIHDVNGNRVYSVRETLLVLDPTFVISRDGIEAAVVKRTTTSGASQDKFEIAMQSGETLHASGKLWRDDGVQITRGNTRIAMIRRQRNVLREMFQASLLPSADQALLLAVAMSIAETDSNRG
jgi:uncharacterized protein YxjI